LNIGINLHYIPVHMQPYYQKFGYKVGDFPNAENYYASAMSLPLYTQLEHQQQDQVVEALIKSLS
jgi:dTDP-4-amino-4,6-dideoxygalactose transaminase